MLGMIWVVLHTWIFFMSASSFSCITFCVILVDGQLAHYLYDNSTHKTMYITLSFLLALCPFVLTYLLCCFISVTGYFRYVHTCPLARATTPEVMHLPTKLTAMVSSGITLISHF
jgi:hypothetical protein